MQDSENSHQYLNANRTEPWFMINDVSPGSITFLPPGFHIYSQLMEYLRKQYKFYGYNEVQTPDICKNALWMKSGHYDNYKENMFSVATDESEQNINTKIEARKNELLNNFIKDGKILEGEVNVAIGRFDEITNVEAEIMRECFSMKPMNCPLHYGIFAHQPRTSAELPLRIAEFGTVHRNEIVGALRGLFRVRKFHQDDAHIFCSQNRSEIAQEIRSFLELLDKTYQLFGFEYKLELSTKPDKALADDNDSKLWEEAEEILREELIRTGKQWELNKGDGAFYGPKIDVHLTDSLNRSHQCGTIQLDFQMPKKMDVWYTDTNGDKKHPCVLHRAVFGSLERFIGILIEHYKGQLPMWLSYRQIMICSLYKSNQDNQQVKEYSKKVKSDIMNVIWKMNIDLDTSDTHIKQKIKSASEKGYHAIIVIGDKEVENGTITIRRGRNVESGKTIENIIEIFKNESPLL